MRNNLIPIGAICICSLFVGCTQESQIFFPEALPADYRFSFSEPFAEVTIPVDGATLNALRFEARRKRSGSEPAAGAVLYLHGNAGSLRSWGGVAGDFTSRGYEILIPDYRGYGKSSGRITSERQLLDDGLAAYRMLARSWPEERIVVYGRSIGTGVATYIARSAKPGMLILESPFLSLTDLASHHYPFLPKRLIGTWLRYPLRNDLWIGEVTAPVFIFHGTNDGIIPFAHSERLLRLTRSSGRLIRIDGGGHNDLSGFAAFGRELDRILR